MSKSLKRVKAEAERLGLNIDIIETPSGTHTAQMAADYVGCELGQIAKSVVMKNDDGLIMYITSGSKFVDINKAEKLAGKLEKANAQIIREKTGFAIGGVSPLGSIFPIRKFFDQTLLTYPEIYAAAGTPHALFCINPILLLEKIDAEIGDFVD